MIKHEVPLLSDPVKASAALLIVSTTIPEPENRRAHLIREMVNMGWDDSPSVEFLALVAMPTDLLEETLLFLKDAPLKAQEKRRQRFFRFANDMFHEYLQTKAVTAVRNGMIVAGNKQAKFINNLKERSDYLRERHGIDLTGELDSAQITTASALLAVMQHMGTEHAYDGIPDEALAELVVEVGEDYPVLIRHMVDRSSFDPELLREMMESSSPAVVSGTL